MIKVVNMIPTSLSGETNQDSEPNLAVNPANPTTMVGTAFTPAPTGRHVRPDLRVDRRRQHVVAPHRGTGQRAVGTGDITVGFRASTGGMLYAGILNGSNDHLQILRTANFAVDDADDAAVDRANEDQPWVVAGSVVVEGA